MKRREVETGRPRRKLIVKRSISGSVMRLVVRRNPDSFKDYVRRLIRVHEAYEKAAAMERRLDALDESGKSGTRAFVALEREWSKTKDRAIKLHEQLGECPY
jgi:hypothetical protein